MPESRNTFTLKAVLSGHIETLGGAVLWTKRCFSSRTLSSSLVVSDRLLSDGNYRLPLISCASKNLIAGTELTRAKFPRQVECVCTCRLSL